MLVQLGEIDTRKALLRQMPVAVASRQSPVDATVPPQ